MRYQVQAVQKKEVAQALSKTLLGPLLFCTRPSDARRSGNESFDSILANVAF